MADYYRPDSVGFKNVQLFKDQTLGIGSYGKVCKAKCDDLLCAAKIIHETLFDATSTQQTLAPQKEHRLPMERFEQECDFLSTIRHPNIVQYLGIYRDPDTGLPALLMELMDNSLTHFIESSAQLIPYHIQVNICHDVTLALSFLHSNSIVHGNLSSNNVLLIGDAVRAKVTDFGIAKLSDRLSFTACPRMDVYLPPEAVEDKPVYTNKVDCFSFGVIVLQILTRHSPKSQQIQINQSSSETKVSEIECRQNDIKSVDPSHPLLQVLLDCLKDRDVERPSAQQLCERLAAINEAGEYTESLKAVQKNVDVIEPNRDEEMKLLTKIHTQEVQDLQEIIQSQVSLLEDKDKALLEKDQAIGELEREKNRGLEERDRQLGRVNQQLETCEGVVAQLQRQITELEQGSKRRGQARIKLVWREGRKAPHKMSCYFNGVADDTTLYVRSGNNVYMFTSGKSSWSKLPNSPNSNCPAVVVNSALTLIGGLLDDDTVTNQLFSLTEGRFRRKWREEFPPMPTKRQGSTAMCTETALIVAGGKDDKHCKLQTVEVMNTETLQWSSAVDLPRALSFAPGTISGDRVYILSLTTESQSMFTCPVNTLTQSRPTGDVWSERSGPRVIQTALVSISGELLTFGGINLTEGETTSDVYLYSPDSDTWESISHMATPRCGCNAALLANNQLIVVGGVTRYSGLTDSVELATIE